MSRFYFLLFMSWLFVFSGSSIIPFFLDEFSSDESVECRDDTKLNCIKSEIQLMRDEIIRELRRISFEGLCPPGFTYLPEVESCYKVIYEELNWTTAGLRCQQLHAGAHLVAITTQEENEAVKKFLPLDAQANLRNDVSHLWTSMQRLDETSCETPFVWKLPKGVQLPLTYEDWNYSPKQPDCHANNEFCVHTAKEYGFRWNDLPCNSRISALCEYDIV